MKPGDRVQISELKAGDVFEWHKKLYWVLYRHSIKHWNNEIVLATCVEIENIKTIDTYKENMKSVTYLGPLTAEMVREMLEQGKD